MIRTGESALCKLRKKYRAKRLKKVCQLDSNSLIPSFSLNVDTSRSLASIARSSKHEPKGRRWSNKEKVLVVSIQKRSPRPYQFLRSLFPPTSRRTLQSILLNTVQFRISVNAHVYGVLCPTTACNNYKDRVFSHVWQDVNQRAFAY
jgi:hypothetical protein